MRVAPEEAAVMVKEWPESLSVNQQLTLFRQLTELELPAPEIKQWHEKSLAGIQKGG